MTAIKTIDEEGEISNLLLKISEDSIGLEDVGELVQWTRRWLVLKDVLEKGQTSYKDLKMMLLGLKPEIEEETEKDNNSTNDEPDDEPDPEPETKKKRKGHGRRGAKDYKGCHHVDIFNNNHNRGDECPECVSNCKGRLSFHKPGRPLTRIRLTGGPPITGTVYRGYPLCCSKCGSYFAPDWPENAKGETYDASAKAIITLMRHWYGFPSYRLEKLQKEMGIPVPDGTQGDLMKEVVSIVEPVFNVLFRRAALANLFILDDTCARIQAISSEHKKYPEQKRYGAHVTGIIARDDEREIYIYRVGTQHAGENLEDLLAHRPKGMPPPLQMSDALAANTDHSFEMIVAYCLNHARGNFADVEEFFPVECGKVLNLFSEIFKYEKETKEQKMCDTQRLAYHQLHSSKPIAILFAYLEKLLNQNLVEPSSGMGKAAKYMLKRKAQLTRFLQIPGAPLDSNAVERALKHAVLIRKNSMFYLNEVTAYNASLFMTLAATAVHNQQDPLHYFTALFENEAKVKANPQAWLPWNYLHDQAPRDG